jgi:hypothetical protein
MGAFPACNGFRVDDPDQDSCHPALKNRIASRHYIPDATC